MQGSVKYGMFVGRFLRQVQRSRSTGSLVSLYDNEYQVRGQPECFDESGGRWVTFCETHYTLCNHQTKAEALAHLPLADWCEECQSPTA